MSIIIWCNIKIANDMIFFSNDKKKDISLQDRARNQFIYPVEYEQYLNALMKFWYRCKSSIWVTNTVII